jgi:hypothetical protein
MSRLIHRTKRGLLAVAMLGGMVAAASRAVGPTSQQTALNPQPIPPGFTRVALNPQPLPPGADLSVALNPQPLPPRLS